MGFEPMTSCLLDRRSNQLSYGAMCIAMRFDEKIYKSLLTGPTQNDMPLSLDCFCVTLKPGLDLFKHQIQGQKKKEKIPSFNTL